MLIYNNANSGSHSSANSAKSLFGSIVNFSNALDKASSYEDDSWYQFGRDLATPSTPVGAVLGKTVSTAASAYDKLVNRLSSSGSPSSSSSYVYSPSSSAREVNVDTFEPQTIDYLNADLAKHYGLGAVTAYQEALSNTAYQRAVKDMKAAGLNPAAIFGSGKGYTAGGVSYIDVPRTEESYTSSRGYAAGSQNGKLFSEPMYHAINTAVGLGTMAIMKKGPIGFYIGQTASKAVLNSLNAIFK